MVTSIKTNKINPLELRGNDRVFQINRDTIFIYTGLHLEDFKPFARIGAGNDYQFNINQMVENILLPERHMWNVGIEEMWLRNSIDLGNTRIRYIGSKEMLSYISKYFDLESYYSQNGKKEKVNLPVEYRIYQPPNQKELSKDKATIIYMHTGDFQVLVGGTRVLDSGNYFRQRITIDKEYTLLKKILEKIHVEPNLKGFSFYLFNSKIFSALFNFNGEFLSINPLEEMHFRLFELNLDPDCIKMAITSSPYLPGFVELFRRADILEKEIAVSYPDVEKLTLLKRIYFYSRPKFFSDGSTLPYARFVNYYESKTKSHAVLAYRLRDDVEQQIKIIFPLLHEKINKNFDYVKGPFDIEFYKIDHKKEVDLLNTSIFYILYQGEILDKHWNKIKLKENIIPAIPNAEFKLNQIVELDEIIDFLQKIFENSTYGEYIINLATKISSFQNIEDLLSIKDDLYLIRTQVLPDDKILLYNLAEALKVIYYFANIHQQLPPDINKLFYKVRNRFSHSKIKIEEFINLGNTIKVNMFMKAGEILGCFLTEAKSVWNITIQYPPDANNAIELEKEYRRYLKEQHKLIDKGIANQNERVMLEFLEKLLEERIFYNEQKNKLDELINALKPNIEILASKFEEKRKKIPFHMKLPYWPRRIVEMVKLPELLDFIEKSIKKFKK